MANDNDNSKGLQEQVLDARSATSPLVIRGGGSKDFYGRNIASNNIADTRSHCGILNYHPTELVLTARAGTPLKEIEQALAANGQMLSCEAPHFSDRATFGGMIAAGLAGPRRPHGGSISDLLLGCTILNGKGEILRFGGQVMKNVAGYDVSRLMVGAMGCLGIILEATIKVMPVEKSSLSFRFPIEADKTSPFVNKLIRLAFPVSASVFDYSYYNEDKKGLLVRFSAGDNEIKHLHHALKKELGNIHFVDACPPDYWLKLREHNNSFFSTQSNLWRISLPPNAPVITLPGETMIEWNGALRWLKTDIPNKDVFSYAEKAGGSATLFKTKTSTDNIFQPLPKPMMTWHKQLKFAFDPANILNPGRMYKVL